MLAFFFFFFSLISNCHLYSTWTKFPSNYFLRLGFYSETLPSMIKNIWCRSGATLLSLWFCFWWDARSGRINAPSRFIHVKIFCSFRPQTSLELGTTNKSRREQKSTLLERLLKLSPHKFILRAVCQDSAHTHTQTETVRGGLRIRAEQLSDVGFWVEKGGVFWVRWGRLSEAADEDRSQ